MTHSPARVRASLAALALGGFAIGTTEFATMGVLPDIAGDLHTTIPDAGWLVSTYALGVVIGAPLFAILGARMPRKALLVALMGGFALANAASALAPSFGTLVMARFGSGLPHGAYFGIASVLAASFVAPERRARAISTVIGGLTIANVAGVPLSTWLGQQFGWRATYWVVALIGAATVVSVLAVVPAGARGAAGDLRNELASLRRLQVWLTLGIAAIGFGGVFAVYSYVAPIMTEVAGTPEGGVPVVLALFGIGMTAGNVLGGRLADRSITFAIVAGSTLMLVVLLTFPLTARTPVTGGLAFLLLGASGATMLPGLATRLLDAAGPAQSLASALMHSAFNIANALGAWLGGAVIAAGLGWTAPAPVGAALCAGGLLVLLVAVRSTPRTPAGPDEPADGIRREAASASAV